MVQYITYFNNELKSALAAKLKLTLATGSHNWSSKKTKRYLLAQNFCLIAMNIAQVWKLRNGDYHLRCVLVQLVYFYHTEFTFVAIFFSPKICVGGGHKRTPLRGGNDSIVQHFYWIIIITTKDAAVRDFTSDEKY